VAPALKETLTSAATRLAQDGGHKIIPVPKFPSFDAAMQLCWALFDLDNDLTSFKNIEDSGEPQVKAVAALYPRALAQGGRTPRTLEELFDLDGQRTQISSQWHRIFVDNELDVLMVPGSQYATATPHDCYGAPPYTAMWNLVNVSRLSRGDILLLLSNLHSIPPALYLLRSRSTAPMWPMTISRKVSHKDRLTPSWILLLERTDTLPHPQTAFNLAVTLHVTFK
jgi:hypothetical protein